MKTESTFIKAFNRGFALQKKNPELFQLINQSFSSENEISEGFKAGGLYYTKNPDVQPQKNHRKMELDRIRNQSHNRELDRDL